MKRVLITATLIFALSLCTLSCQRTTLSGGNMSAANGANPSNASKASAGNQPPAPPKTNLKVGDTAPDFTLTDTEGQPVKLSDFRGKKNVVLAFYVLAFTGG